MTYRLLLSLLLLCGLSIATMAQTPKFTDLELKSPKKNGDSLVTKFNLVEVERFELDSVGPYIYLENNLRSSTYANPEAWLAENDRITPVKISIVFSKYPIRDGVYSMHYPLLFNRLKRLFEIDPALNTTAVEWEIVLQTDCSNDEEADALYHGVVIEYPRAPEVITAVADSASSSDTEETVLESQMTAAELDSMRQQILNNPLLPDTLVQQFATATPDQQVLLLQAHYEAIISDTVDMKREDIDSAYLENNLQQLRTFMRVNRSWGKSIAEVFDRHEEWDNALVVCDWTGSMYGYGSQVLEWHIMNFERSGLNYFTLFNDGDRKINKQIGETGGIYHEKTDNLHKLIALYNYVQTKGYGGDGPENDIEAILEGQKKFKKAEQIILIADNNACVRDIELITQIGVPVHVILCGYRDSYGVNPQYLELAYTTGGSIHTIEEDIESFDTEEDRFGNTFLKEFELKIAADVCSSRRRMGEMDGYSAPGELYTELKTAKKENKTVKHLDLSDQNLSRYPKTIRKMNGLISLNLSNNTIKKLPKCIHQNNLLKSLDIHNNKLEKLPVHLGANLLLRHLDASDNELTFIPKTIPRLKHLEYLNLSGNKLEWLPATWGCKQLQALYLADNELEKIPSGLFSCRALIELNLSGNSLVKIPNSLGKLKKLEVLDLSNNPLTKIPKGVVKLKQLQTLIISGTDIPEEDLAKLRQLLPNTTIVY